MHIDLKQLEFIDENLRLIALEVEEVFGSQTITSLYRMHDSGVHGQLPLRGIDLRCKIYCFGQEIEEYINEQWEYDYKRPKMHCCLFHDTGRGLHIHLQTHPNTRKR